MGTVKGKSWLEALFAFFYPPVCQVCMQARAEAAAGYVCEGCAATIRAIEPPMCRRCGLPFEGEITTTFECANCQELGLEFSWARAGAKSEGLLRDIIHRYKYRGAIWFEPFLAEWLLRAAAPLKLRGNWDMIIPVPLHPLKEREREFNQAERLAVRLARHTGIPMSTGALRRVAPTRSQTLLRRRERLENVRNAFQAPLDVTGQRIILVDDILTTGATTSACAGALREAGAADVVVLTSARGGMTPPPFTNSLSADTSSSWPNPKHA
jgi:competence protein ComFC